MYSKDLFDFITKNIINIETLKIFGRKKLKELEIPNNHFAKSKKEYIYDIIYNITEQPLCEVCKKNSVNFIDLKNGYRKNCSLSCSQKNPTTQNKIKSTNLKRYGVENPSQSEKIKEKKKRTTKEHYGVENPSQSEQIKNKIKSTNLKRYGVENPSQSEKIKEKKKRTTKEHYGVENPSQSKQIKEKRKETNLKRYGVENPSQSKQIKEKRKETNLKRYGVENIFQDEIVKKKIIDKNLKKYNVSQYSQRNIKNYQRYNKEFIENFLIKNGEIDIQWCLKYFNVNMSSFFKFLKKENIKYLKTKTNRAQTQKEIYIFIKETLNNRKIDIYFNEKQILLQTNLELDIYIPEYKLAIEYNGLMYHSFGISKYSMFNNFTKEKEKKHNHLKKTEECEKQGIQLLHINENEWLDDRKQKIWKSIIKSKLGVLDNRIYARKCEIKEISTKETKEFLESNHIQGYSISKINLGLYEKESNKLVSIMTFGKPRYNNKADYELIRFCSLINTSVIGGGSKLLKYFQKKYMKQNETLISYGNRRWTYFVDNFYKSNNFKFIEKTKINYYYFHEKEIFKLYHRVTFQKFRIKNYYQLKKKNITIYNEEDSGSINMYKNGYRRIYDSGQIIYIY